MQSTSFMSAMLADYFNLPFEIKSVATTGTTSQLLMLERGDINSWTSSTVWHQMPIRRPGWSGDGTIKPFADMSFPGYTIGANSEADLDCPQVTTFMSEAQQKEWGTFAGLRSVVSKNIIGPPKINPDVTAALRKALDDAMKDKDFAAGLTKFAGIPNNYTPGDTLQGQMEELVQGFRAQRTEYDALRTKYYGKYVN